MIDVKIIPNKNRGEVVDTSVYSFAATENVRNLHTSLDAYNVTPLIELKNFSAAKKIRALFVKDESTRFGLKAFKGLGGVWAIYKVISRELGLDNPTLEEIFQHRTQFDKMTFITTTDGNHGKGVSWAAGLFGCKAFVYMPKDTVEIRAQAIRDAYIEASNAHALRMDAATESESLQRCGATAGSNVTFASNAHALRMDAATESESLQRCGATTESNVTFVRDAGTATVEITDLSYDDCVKFTAHLAEKNHWHLIQDTSWTGYEEIPAQIMLGYSTLAYEALRQMQYTRPTHIFLQAGVGSMAGAIAAVFAEVFKDNPPRITIVEPTEVACFYETMRVGDGLIHSATGNGRTMMAGLNCATPCELAWRILRRFAADTATISDDVTADAMRCLAKPFGDDKKIISGESGCAGFALANAALDSPELRRALEIDENAIIFVINTEGATDPDNYNKVLGTHY